MIKQIDPQEIPIKQAMKVGKYRSEINEFLASDAIACECFFDPKKFSSLASARQVYRNVVKRMKAPVIVTVRGDRIFLIKKKMEDKNGR